MSPPVVGVLRFSCFLIIFFVLWFIHPSPDLFSFHDNHHHLCGALCPLKFKSSSFILLSQSLRPSLVLALIQPHVHKICLFGVCFLCLIRHTDTSVSFTFSVVLKTNMAVCEKCLSLASRLVVRIIYSGWSNEQDYCHDNRSMFIRSLSQWLAT